MKKTVISVMLGLCMFLTLTAQAKSNSDIPDDFYAYMGSKIKYPEKARLMNLQGNSLILFTLNDGKLNDLKIETELGEGCDVEVLNVLLAYQHFKTMKNGKYAMITSFRLTGSTAAIKHENIGAPVGFEALKLTVMANASASSFAVIKNYGQSTTSLVVNNNQPMVFHSSNTNPKVYIDSIQVDYDELKYIAPKNIQSIHIYKGASAIANYGVDAIHGVIVIDTKKEKVLLRKDTSTNKQN